MTTDMVGTLNYMSPEQLQETEDGSKAVKVGKWADSWSLGCILYLMAYGKLPFQEFKNNMMKISKIVDPAFPIDFPKHSCLGLGLFSSFKVDNCDFNYYFATSTNISMKPK